MAGALKSETRWNKLKNERNQQNKQLWESWLAPCFTALTFHLEGKTKGREPRGLLTKSLRGILSDCSIIQLISLYTLGKVIAPIPLRGLGCLIISRASTASIRDRDGNHLKI